MVRLSPMYSAILLGRLLSPLILSFPLGDFFFRDAEHLLDCLLKATKRIAWLLLKCFLRCWHQLPQYHQRCLMEAPPGLCRSLRCSEVFVPLQIRRSRTDANDIRSTVSIQVGDCAPGRTDAAIIKNLS
jgi:hypothetical protein